MTTMISLRPSALQRRILLGGTLLWACMLAVTGIANASDDPTSDAVWTDVSTAPVIVDGSVLFQVRGTSALPADERAGAIAQRVVDLAADPDFQPQALRIVAEQPGSILIMAGNRILMGVFDADARLEGVETPTLAIAIVTRVSQTIDTWRQEREPAVLLRRGLIATGATLALALLLWGGGRLVRWARAMGQRQLAAQVHDVTVFGFPVVAAQQLWSLLGVLARAAWLLAALFAIQFYLSSVLVLFPWTRGFAINLIALLLAPLGTLGIGFVKSLPDLIFLAVLYVAVRYVLRMVKLFFDGVADGTQVLPNFEQEWALPTRRLVNLLVIVIAVVIAYPHVPGSDSDAFKGMSLLLGFVMSLGASSMIGNIVAGYTMTYRRLFKVGDRIRIGEHFGDVAEVHLLVTYLRTVKNEIVVIPNSNILGAEVVNYSKLADKTGLILHTTVGIGYETPWRQVEAMLLEASARTPGLLRKPPPFVLHKALGDFSITYEINAYCSDPQAMLQLYTALHRNILDQFNEYGVQIMTPAYRMDPSQPKVVPREDWYAAPARPSPPPTPVGGQGDCSGDSSSDHPDRDLSAPASGHGTTGRAGSPSEDSSHGKRS